MVGAGSACASTREEAAAPETHSREARRAVREEKALILESVRAIVRDVLHAGGFAVAAPVGARFRRAASGTTGVELTVELEDPAHAVRAAAVLTERFGGAGPPDAIIVR